MGNCAAPLAAVRAVFFDAVGTLLRPHPPAALVYAAVGRRFGSRLSEAEIAARFRAAFAREEAVDRAAGWRTDEPREQRRWRAIVGSVLDDVRDPDACFAELFGHFGLPGAWRCEPEAAALLATLAGRGYLLGLASNFDARLRAVAAGLADLRPVRHLVVSSEVGWRKPAAAFYAALQRVAGRPSEQVLLVGDDRANDLDGARAAGLAALLYDPQGRPGGVGPARIGRLSDLPPLLPDTRGAS